MQQPHMLELDPQQIEFNPNNPRKHSGEEYEHLKASIQEIGIVQPPLVRHKSANIYEVIDGEGRVSIAQELKMPKIKVVSFGDVSIEEALEKLVTSNTVRTFDFLAQCKGMASIHRQGKTLDQIAKMLGIPFPGMVSYYVGVGYLPEDILETMSIDMVSSDERKQVWSKYLIRSLLPLRQLLPGKSDTGGRGNNASPMDETLYNFDEIRLAVKKVVNGEILNGADMRTYVAERNRELAEQHHKQAVKELVEAEIARYQKELDRAKELDIEKATEKTQQSYQVQIDALQAQIDAFASSDLKTLSQELSKFKETQATIKQEITAQLKAEQEKELAEWRKKTEDAEKAREEVREKERKEAEKAQKQYKKDLAEEYKLQAQTTYRKQLATTSVSIDKMKEDILHITSPGMITGFDFLPPQEIGSILSAMRAARDTLEQAEYAIQEKLGLASPQEDVDSTITRDMTESELTENEQTQQYDERSLITKHY